MIVVAIMGVVLTMSVPIVYKAWHKAPMSKAVSEIMEVCSHARQQAIMKGVEVDVMFHPHEGRFEVSSGPVGAAQQATNNAASAPSFSSGVVSSNASGFSGRLSDKIAIELMDINKLPHEFRDDDLARVRFFPNGTCDELTLILLSDQGDRRELTLEVTTGLLSVESDPRHFK
jgi:type II secretory pathway pseudopilin PulG